MNKNVIALLSLLTIILLFILFINASDELKANIIFFGGIAIIFILSGISIASGLKYFMRK